MTATSTDPRPGPRPAADARNDTKVISLIGAGHFFSHYYIVLLPPLFPLLRDHFSVSYTAIGLSISVLNVVTALTQAPVGFLVDRYGARVPLFFGLVLFALGMGLVGVFPYYWALLALMVVAGLGNSVFHPADYAILSSSVNQTRMGRAFSIHTFSGFLGTAVAPPIIVFLAATVGWQTALIASGAAGLVMAGVIASQSHVLRDERGIAERAKALGAAGKPAGGAAASSRSLLLTTPIVMSFVFYLMTAITNGGVAMYTVSVLHDLRGISLTEAAVPLSVYLFASAFGVLAGGVVADRTRRHHLVAGGCFLVTAAMAALIAGVPMPFWALLLPFGVAGFFNGMVAPSRDMMVRAVTPPGQSGKVFGFVTTGFNVAGVITPALFGLILDAGRPDLVFWVIAAFSLATLVTVVTTGRRD